MVAAGVCSAGGPRDAGRHPLLGLPVAWPTSSARPSRWARARPLAQKLGALGAVVLVAAATKRRRRARPAVTAPRVDRPADGTASTATARRRPRPGARRRAGCAPAVDRAGAPHRRDAGGRSAPPPQRGGPPGRAPAGRRSSSARARGRRRAGARRRRRPGRSRSCVVGPRPHGRPGRRRSRCRCLARVALAGQGVDDRDADEHPEHAERHPTPEERGHRAGSGTDTVGRSGAPAPCVTRTRGRRCDS